METKTEHKEAIGVQPVTKLKQQKSSGINREQIKEIAKKEAEELENRISYQEKKHLILKLTYKDIRKSLVYDTELSKYTSQFTMDWYSFMDNYRKYQVSLADTFELDLDDAAPQEIRDVFRQAWKKHFADEIVKVNRDNKKIKKRITLCAIFGSLINLLIITSYLIYAAYSFAQRGSAPTPTYKAFAILTIVLGYGIYVFGWGMLWDMFSMIFGSYADGKRKLENLFLLYKA